MAHILLAEDDESLRKFLAAALAKAGHVVTDFGDGDEAWECIQGFAFDLLLTDIVMPGMDGIELAKRAAERNVALKIMFITGFAAVALHPASGAPDAPGGRGSGGPSRDWEEAQPSAVKSRDGLRLHRPRGLTRRLGT